MRYVLLICADQSAAEALSPEEAQASTEGYMKWMADAQNRGVLQGGERLRPATDATTVRIRDGKTLSVDGPYAETKEQLGGYFVVDCKDLDEATELAAGLPDAKSGSIEVRPIWEM
jgi:hypothetical protein